MREGCLESFNTHMGSGGHGGGLFSWIFKVAPPKAILGGEHCEMDHTLIYLSTK